MSLTIRELREKRLPPDYLWEHEHKLPAAQCTVYENMRRLYCALEDNRLTGVDPSLRGSVASLIAAMGRMQGREAAEERTAALLASGVLRQQLVKTCRSLGTGDSGSVRRAEETRELLQYVGAGLGIEAPELDISDAQRKNVRAVEAKTGAAWRDFRERNIRMAAARLMVAEQRRRDASQKDVPPEAIEERVWQLAESDTFRTMCDALPDGELRKAVDARDGMKLVNRFADELERESRAEKRAEPDREAAPEKNSVKRNEKPQERTLI